MKFLITPAADGDYFTENEHTVSILSATEGTDFANEAAFAAKYRLTPRVLWVARKRKIAEAKVESRKPVKVGAISLASDTDTQGQFNNLVTLLQLALAAQPSDAHRAALNATLVSSVAGPIADATGNSHDMTVAEVFALVLAYGQGIGAARAREMTQIAAVKAAGTVEAVNAIVFNAPPPV